MSTNATQHAITGNIGSRTAIWTQVVLANFGRPPPGGGGGGFFRRRRLLPLGLLAGLADADLLTSTADATLGPILSSGAVAAKSA